MADLEQSLRAARALAGPAAAAVADELRNVRGELVDLREALEDCEAGWWTDEIRDGLERIIAAHACRNRGADAAHRAAMSQLQGEADGRAAAEAAARAARAEAADLADLVEASERRLQRYLTTAIPIARATQGFVHSGRSAPYNNVHPLLFPNFTLAFN